MPQDPTAACPDADDLVPSDEAAAAWPRYGRPLHLLFYTAKFRRLKDPTAHPVVEGMQHKVCCVCCQAKPLEAYRRRRDGLFGRVAHCIACAPERCATAATRR